MARPFITCHILSSLDGKINQTFLEAGLIDELSLVIAPASEGNARSVAVFEQFAGAGTAPPVQFRLLHAEQIGQVGVWLRYAPVHT